MAIVLEATRIQDLANHPVGLVLSLVLIALLFGIVSFLALSDSLQETGEPVRGGRVIGVVWRLIKNVAWAFTAAITTVFNSNEKTPLGQDPAAKQWMIERIEADPDAAAMRRRLAEDWKRVQLGERGATNSVYQVDPSYLNDSLLR